MAEQPKISIITPSFNQGSYITDCIQSVPAQDYPALEHIIIDAKSTDETLDVLKTHDHLPHLMWTSEPDEGQTDAINKGFKMAKGDIVAWLNADDYYLSGAFDKVSREFAKNPELDVIYGEAVFVDKNGNQLRTKRDHAFDYQVLLYYGCYIMSTATFFRRRIIDDGNFLDKNYKVTMDYEYFVRLASKGYKFGFIPAPLAAFRWHETNVSALNGDRRRKERLKVQRQYGGLDRVENDNLRVRCFDALAKVYQAKRVAKRMLEKITGQRNRQVY